MKVTTLSCGPAPTFKLLKPLLGVVLDGEHDCRWRQSGHTYERRCKTGSFTLINAPVQISDFEERAKAEHLLVEIDLAAYNQWSGNHFSSKELPLIVSGENGPVASLAVAMADEIARGCSGGPLYGESLSLSLVSYLEGRFSTNRVSSDPQGLSVCTLRRLREFIQCNLDQELSLSGLAEVARLSPHHLCRSFKKAVGITPHRYVLEARIEKAKKLLDLHDMTVAEVALATGFCSQSHFSDTFRRIAGESPRRFRSLSLLRHRKL